MAEETGMEGVLDRGKVTELDRTSSPATLLLVVGEPFTIEQKDLILERIVSELYAWDSETAKCDVDEQLGTFARQQPKGQDGPNGEKIFELKSDHLKVTVLLNPRVQTVREKIRAFLLSLSRYRHLLHSGLALHGTGCWILQDGIFSFSSFSDVFHKPDVVEAVGRESDAVLDISVLAEGTNWTEGSLKKLSPHMKVRLNPAKSQKHKEDGVIQFTDILSLSLKAPSSIEILQATDIVGNISFQRPTIYVFPAGSGDSALFGISGFNLLVNGGYSRRSCFWQFIRHLIRIDAILVSHVGPDNIFGLSTFFERKAVEKTSPDLGVVYMNIGDTKAIAPNGNLPVSTGLLVSLADEGAGLVDHLRHIGMTVHPCTGLQSGQTLQSFNLYYKVGQGSLDLYVLNPLNGKELKDFLGNWARNINNTKGGVPVSDEHSVCSVLVWKPSCPKEKVVRILFPGNAPHAKIAEGLEKLKNVGLFQSWSGSVEKSESTGKVSEKKPSSGVGKPPTGRQGVVQGSEAEKPLPEKKAAAAEHKEMKKPLEHKDAKKPAEHKTRPDTEAKKADGKPEHKAPGKSDTHLKKTEVKQEHKPVGKQDAETTKKMEGKLGAEHKGTGWPESEPKKADAKRVPDHKESKVPVKPETEQKKIEGKHGVEPKEGKKTGGVEPKVPKKTTATPSAAAAAATVKDAKVGVKHEPAAGKVAKTQEKAVKDVKNKQVAKEVRDTKTPIKKTPGKVEKEQKKEEGVKAEGEVKVEKVAVTAAAAVADITAVAASPVQIQEITSEVPVPDITSEVPVPEEMVQTEEHAVDVNVSKDGVLPEKDLEVSDFSEPVKDIELIDDHFGKAEVEVNVPEPAVQLVPEPAVQIVPEPAFEEEVVTSENAGGNLLDFDENVEVPLISADLGVSGNLLGKEPMPIPTLLIQHDFEPEGGFESADVELETEESQFVSDTQELEAANMIQSLENEGTVSADDRFIMESEACGFTEGQVSGFVEGQVSGFAGGHPPATVDDFLGYSDDVEVEDVQEEQLEVPAKAVHIEDQESIHDDEDLPSDAVEKELLEEPEKAGNLECEVEDREGDHFAVDPEPDFAESHPSMTAQNLFEPEDFGEEEQLELSAIGERSEREDASYMIEQHASYIEKQALETSEKWGDLNTGEKSLLGDFETEGTSDLLEVTKSSDESKSTVDDSIVSETDILVKVGEPEVVKKDEPVLEHEVSQKEDWIPMEDTRELPPVEEHPVEDSGAQRKPDLDAGGDTINEAKDHSEDLFDPQSQWGQPDGLPAPVNGKEGGSGKKADQSLLHNTSVSGAKKTTGQPGKKADGKDPLTKTKRPATAPDDSEKPVDDSAKAATNRTATPGVAKKPSGTTVKDSVSKTSHTSDSKKLALKPVVPFFVDLAYMPCHGDVRCVDRDFFRMVRARYYVLSSPEPNPQVLDLFLSGKETWENTAEETIIIPTYDTELLAQWVVEHQERLKKLNVTVAPSASRCTMQLQEHEASCPAYRLEF